MPQLSSNRIPPNTGGRGFVRPPAAPSATVRHGYRFPRRVREGLIGIAATLCVVTILCLAISTPKRTPDAQTRRHTQIESAAPLNTFASVHRAVEQTPTPAPESARRAEVIPAVFTTKTAPTVTPSEPAAVESVSLSEPVVAPPAFTPPLRSELPAPPSWQPGADSAIASEQGASHFDLAAITERQQRPAPAAQPPPAPPRATATCNACRRVVEFPTPVPPPEFDCPYCSMHHVRKGLVPQQPPVTSRDLRGNLTLNIHVNGKPTVAWSDGYVDVWADNGARHYVLPPGSRLNFPNSGTIHARPRSAGATKLYLQPMR